MSRSPSIGTPCRPSCGVTAVQLTLTVLALAGLVQADVVVGAAGKVCVWASPAFVVATWTVQLAVAQAVPDETRRLRAPATRTATRRAPRRTRWGSPRRCRSVLGGATSVTSWSRSRWPGSSSKWPCHRSPSRR